MRPVAHALAAATAASGAGAHELLIGLLGAVAVFGPAVIGFWLQSKRSRKMEPREEDELVARTSKEAVEAIGQVLAQQRDERTALLVRLAEVREECERLTERVADAEAREAATQRKLEEVERELRDLQDRFREQQAAQRREQSLGDERHRQHTRAEAHERERAEGREGEKLDRAQNLGDLSDRDQARENLQVPKREGE